MALAGAAHAQVLYDGTNTTNPLPEQQGWLALGNVTGASETYSSTNSYTTVSTLASNSIYAGFSNYAFSGSLVNTAFPSLSSAAGFTLSFTVQDSSDPTAFSSTHPRSALSVILLDSNHTGIEIGILPDQIFSQASDFNSVSQTVSSALGASVTSYSLSILGNSYTLSSGGTTLLTGATKQYTSSEPPGSLVYGRNNFLFLGDDTTSDGGTYNIKAVSLSAAPEPETLPLALVGGSMVFGASRALRLRARRK
jgi:hypothetical protein